MIVLPPIVTVREGRQTTHEREKLARRRHEYALLHDALRRGVPYQMIPFFLAGLKRMFDSAYSVNWRKTGN